MVSAYAVLDYIRSAGRPVDVRDISAHFLGVPTVETEKAHLEFRRGLSTTMCKLKRMNSIRIVSTHRGCIPTTYEAVPIGHVDRRTICNVALDRFQCSSFTMGDLVRESGASVEDCKDVMAFMMKYGLAMRRRTSAPKGLETYQVSRSRTGMRQIKRLESEGGWW